MPVSPVGALEGQLVAHKDAQLHAADVYLHIILLDPKWQLKLKRHLAVCLCKVHSRLFAHERYGML